MVRRLGAEHGSHWIRALGARFCIPLVRHCAILWTPLPVIPGIPFIGLSLARWVLAKIVFDGTVLKQRTRLNEGRQMYRNFGKRLLDLTITVPILILLSPVIAVVALLVRLKLGSPVLFSC